MASSPFHSCDEFGSLGLQGELARGLHATSESTGLSAGWVCERQGDASSGWVIPLVHVRRVLRDRDAACASSAEASDVARQREVDGVYHSALARPVRPDHHEGTAAQVEVEVANAAKLFYSKFLNLDHSADSPLASV